MHHILIVDDDRLYTTMLRFLLENEGYMVTALESAERALESLEHTDYDLLLLDVVMPDMDGLDLCRRIRATSDVPIIFLSVRSDVTDQVLGLQAGADDYLTKPFDPHELLVRIWRLLQRAGRASESALQTENADLTLDLSHYTVTLHRTGEIVHLTPTEARLLHILLRNTEHSMSREALGVKLWGSDYVARGRKNELDVYIARLRNKLEGDPSYSKLIQTLRGFGYRFAPIKTPVTDRRAETKMQALS